MVPLDRLRERGTLFHPQPRQLARRLAVHKTRRPLGVKARHPVPHDLQADAADSRSLGPARAIIDRRKWALLHNPGGIPLTG